MTKDLTTTKQPGLIERMGAKYGVDGKKLYACLRDTAFKGRDGNPVSDEQMMALLIVSDQYGLNPFTKEIYAFPDKQNGIIPIIGIDGWARIINENPQFDGIEFRESEKTVTMEGAKQAPEWIECIIHRKDREHPTVVREYLDEVYRTAKNHPGPWQTHTKRFLRHKATIQCARLAFGYVGIYDQDEAERIIDAVHDEDYQTPPAMPTRKAEVVEPEDVEVTDEETK